MVKLNTIALVSLCYVATLGLCAPSRPNTVTHVQRSVVQIKTDITDITTQLTTLSTTIDKIDPKVASVNDASAVHVEGQSLCKGLAQAASDIKSNGAINEADSRELLALLQGFPAAANHTMSTLVAKKLAFQNIPIGNFFAAIRQDLINLHGNASEFNSDEISTSCAPDLASNFRSICNSVIVSIGIGIEAYES